MSRAAHWRIAYFLLLVVFIATAALNMRGLRAGFLTNHAADLVVPAWMYVMARGLHAPGGRTTFAQRTLGRSPERAASTLFVASALAEASQLYWPHGVFRGRFDPLDIASYALGLAVCYAAERLWPGETAAIVPSS